MAQLKAKEFLMNSCSILKADFHKVAGSSHICIPTKTTRNLNFKKTSGLTASGTLIGGTVYV